MIEPDDGGKLYQGFKNYGNENSSAEDQERQLIVMPFRQGVERQI